MALSYLGHTIIFALGAGAWVALAARPIGAPAAALLRALVIVSLGFSGHEYFGIWLGSSAAERLHVHEFYHYFLGSKYYRELGHTRLYACTWEALAQLRRDGVPAPALPLIRDLASPGEVLAGEALAKRAAACRDRFSADRWRAFRHDLASLVASRPDPRLWQGILGDLGNNSPPTWNVLPALIAGFVPLDAAALTVLPLLD